MPTLFTQFSFSYCRLENRLSFLKIKMKESTVSPTVLFSCLFLIFSHLPHNNLTPIRPSGRIQTSPPAPTTSLAAARPSLRDAAWQHWKSGQEKPEKWRPFERLKSGAQHQISRHSELGKHQAFLANNAGVCRKTSIFLRFSPAFPPLPCASRKGGRATARRPLYLHNSSVNRANSCKFNASPRIVSGQPQAVIAASISSFEKCSSSEFFSPFASVFRL